LLSVIAGCKSTIETDVDTMAKPVIVAAISEDGTVVLRDATGEILVIPNDYYLARAIKSTFAVGAVFVPLPDR
jgi:hypothetical protein